MFPPMQRAAANEFHKTRLAPSPTGALHLGNARTFLINWALARQHDWRIVLRIDDLDGPRIKRGSAEQAIDVLRWLGIDWDEGPYYQSEAVADYRTALEQLVQSGAVYPCGCTRSDLLAAAQSAPHAGDHELRYPGICRPDLTTSFTLSEIERDQVAWRLRVPDCEMEVMDRFRGIFRANVQAEIGDFVVATKRGTASYQLAVVIDDVQQGIDRVVRGDDLLSSTLRQRLVYEHLELGPLPDYWHLPLVVGDDGRRLAKRHGDSRLVHYREQHVRAERIIALLAEWCGIAGRSEMQALEFLDAFDLERVPHAPIVFREADDAWLLKGRS